MGDDLFPQFARFVEPIGDGKGRFGVRGIDAAALSATGFGLGHVLADALADHRLHRLQGLGVQIRPLLEDTQQVVGDEVGKPRGRRRRQFGTRHQGGVPELDSGRAVNQVVQGFLADLGAGVGKKVGDGFNVVGGGDRFGDALVDLGTPRDGGQAPLRGTASDELQQVLVRQHRRELEHRTGDRELGVQGQPLDDIGWRVGHVLQGLGQNLAHPRDLVAGQDLQRLVGRVAEGVARVGIELGHHLGDLLGQVRAHGLMGVACQFQVGLARRGGVGGRRLTHLDRRVFGKEIEDLGPKVLARGQGPAHLGVLVTGEAFGLFIGEGVGDGARI